MKSCFIVATKKEASPFIEASSAKKNWQKGQAGFYSSEFFDVLICGIGPLHSALSVGWLYGMDHDEWINIGIAGSLKKTFSVGEIYEVGTVLSNTVGLNHTPIHKLPLREKGATLFSATKGIHDPKEREELGKIADLVDMESFGLACAAKAKGVPFRSFKVVSDLCSEQEDFKVIVSRIPSLMEKLWKNKFVDMIPPKSFG